MHPALYEYRIKTGRKVAGVWEEEIKSTVGTRPEQVARWGDVIKAYLGQGWNSGSVDKMLGYFRDNRMPGERTKKQQAQETTTKRGDSIRMENGRKIIRLGK